MRHSKEFLKQMGDRLRPSDAGAPTPASSPAAPLPPQPPPTPAAAPQAPPPVFVRNALLMSNHPWGDCPCNGNPYHSKGHSSGCEFIPTDPEEPLDTFTLCLVVLSQSHALLEQFPVGVARAESAELSLIVNTGARFGGLGAVANRVLDRSLCDVFGIVHADTVFEPGALRRFTQAAGEGAVTGLVGRRIDGAYIWSKMVGAQRVTPVSTLDCCSIFFRRDSGLRFDDETFDSFHCCVEDVCLLATSKGIPVQVVAANADHKAHSTHKRSWVSARELYRKKLSDKWPHIRHIIT